MRKLTWMSGILLSGAALADDGMKVGGFVDVGFNWLQTKVGNADATATTNTFALNDAALYLGKTMGMGEVMLDLPVGATGTNDLAASGSKAQAWLSWKYDNGFMWKLGKFDKFIGAEKNDTKDNFFGGGLVNQELIGFKTHTGLHVGYEVSDSLSVGLLAANPKDQNTTAAKAGNFDYGVNVATKMDNVNAKVGVLFMNPTGTTKSEYLVDIGAGMSMDNMNFGLGVSFDKRNQKTGLGFVVMADYGLSDMTKLGLQFDYVKKGEGQTWTVDPTDADATSAAVTANNNARWGIKVGPAFEMSKDLTITAGFTYDNWKGTSANKATQTGFLVSAIHNF